MNNGSRYKWLAIAVLCAVVMHFGSEVAYMQPTKYVPAGPHMPFYGTSNISGASAPMPPSTIVPIAMSTIAIAKEAKSVCSDDAAQLCTKKLTSAPVQKNVSQIVRTLRQPNGGNIAFAPLCVSLLTLFHESLETYCASINQMVTRAMTARPTTIAPKQSLSDQQWAALLVQHVVRYAINKDDMCMRFSALIAMLGASGLSQALKSLCEALFGPAASAQTELDPKRNEVAYAREKKESDRIIRALDRPTQEALAQYTAAEAITINHCLRGTAQSSCADVQRRIDAITRALSKKTLGKIVLYRGGGYSLIGAKKATTGSAIHNRSSEDKYAMLHS